MNLANVRPWVMLVQLTQFENFCLWCQRLQALGDDHWTCRKNGKGIVEVTLC